MKYIQGLPAAPSSINTHIYTIDEDNVIYADLFACKFNTNNNNYTDLPTKSMRTSI